MKDDNLAMRPFYVDLNLPGSRANKFMGGRGRCGGIKHLLWGVPPKTRQCDGNNYETRNIVWDLTADFGRDVDMVAARGGRCGDHDRAQYGSGGAFLRRSSTTSPRVLKRPQR